MTTSRCTCGQAIHAGHLVVVTGGPGAGKSAFLEVIRRAFCDHVLVLPEAATILFSGGFPRPESAAARRAAQRAISKVQMELERTALEEGRAGIILCDRGVLDGLAYWDDSPETFYADVGVSREALLNRYRAVLHLHTPSLQQGYDHSNPVRLEGPDEAQALDERIWRAWEGHPHRLEVSSEAAFMNKLHIAVTFLRDLVPPCCRAHPVPEAGLP